MRQDFILSILEASPSVRDSRFYLKAFAPPKEAVLPVKGKDKADHAKQLAQDVTAPEVTHELPRLNAVTESFLEPDHQHTGIVKVQGPFSDRQLNSIAEGLVYLRRLGLVSMIVVDLDDWSPEHPDYKLRMRNEVLRVTDMLEQAGGEAQPILEALVTASGNMQKPRYCLEGEMILRKALESGKMPVIAPSLLGPAGHSYMVSTNDFMRVFALTLSELSSSASNPEKRRMDITPLRLMVINREGGIPSYARGGTPHLSINLESEFDHIKDTYIWQESHPSALATLDMLRDCLQELPRTSSGIVVSHRSSKALIANLITNKPAHSPSLHRSALPSSSQLQSIPTIVRYGLPIRVIRSLQDVDLTSLTRLLEKSFRRELDVEAYYGRLNERLDFMVVAGDCAAVAIVTREGPHRDLTYLDKFAVLPELQGDGTVDFLWGALRDESFGLGLLDAANNNGGLEGRGVPVDLVWRSRADNPVNKWYFERSSGFAKLTEMGKGGVPGVLFWSDAEKRVKQHEDDVTRGPAPFIAEEEESRLSRWSNIIGVIPR